MEKTKGHRLPTETKIQRIAEHAKHWIRHGKENQTRLTKRILEVCRQKRQGLGPALDAQQKILCGDCAQRVDFEEETNRRESGAVERVRVE